MYTYVCVCPIIPNYKTFFLSILGLTTQRRWQSGRPTRIMAAAKDFRPWSSTPTFITSTALSWPAAPWRWARWLPRTLLCWLTIAGTDRQTWWTRKISCTGSRPSYDAEGTKEDNLVHCIITSKLVCKHHESLGRCWHWIFGEEHARGRVTQSHFPGNSPAYLEKVWWKLTAVLFLFFWTEKQSTRNWSVWSSFKFFWFSPDSSPV